MDSVDREAVLDETETAVTNELFVVSCQRCVKTKPHDIAPIQAAWIMALSTGVIKKKTE